MDSGPVSFSIPEGDDGPEIRGEVDGEGTAIVLCHGLSATRRYVVHGSRHLPRRGYRLTTYDARGHGESGAADVYDYAGLAGDLERVVRDREGTGPVIFGGHSMGCHTVARRALESPGSVSALILAGPVFVGPGGEDETRWDARADAMEESPEAFADVVSEGLGEAVRDTVWRIARDRARLHLHPAAVAEALRQIPRSSPFGSVDELAGIEVPVLVVASQDDTDPSHPYAVAEAWAEAIPGAEMVSEDPGQSPLVWQGGKLSRVIDDFLGRHGLAPAG